MSFSSGTFSINTAGQPVVTGTVISSTAFNALTADLATGLSTCVLKDGTQTMTANIPMGNFKLTGLGTATANGDALGYFTGTFTATLVGCTTSPTVLASYAVANKTVAIYIPAGLNGTSNATSMSITGFPVSPVTTQSGMSFAAADNNANLTTPARADIGGGSAILTLYKDFAGGNWTSSGTKGLQGSAIFIFSLF